MESLVAACEAGAVATAEQERLIAGLPLAMAKKLVRWDILPGAKLKAVGLCTEDTEFPLSAGERYQLVGAIRANVEASQELARHSTTVLVYARMRWREQAAVLAGLPDFSPGPCALQTLRAKGTD